MRRYLSATWDFIATVFEKFINDRAPKLGAALSFYTMFSLAPLLVIAVSVAGFMFGEEAAKGEIVNQIQDLIGREGAEVVQTALRNARYADEGLAAIIMSSVTLLIGSTIVFADLHDSLNMIWKVKAKPGASIIRGLIRDRLRSFALVVSTGILLLASLIASAVISAVKTFMSDQLYELPVYLSNFTNTVVSFVIIYLMFMAIYKILPDVHLRWRSVWIGALVTSLLFTLGKYLIGLYLGSSTLSSTYGAAGSLVVLLLWIYYSSQILFLGAEFTQVYANRFGEGIVPRSNFEKYTDETAVAELPEKEPESAEDG